MKFGSANKYNKLKSSFMFRMYEEPFYQLTKPSYVDEKLVRGSCGTYALSSLFDVPPEIVSKWLPKTAKTWSDREIKKILDKKGWIVKEVTVTALKTNEHYIETPINQDHILLVGQRTSKHEGTWAFAYKNKWIHNYETMDLNPLEFVNNPIMSAYVLCRKTTVARNATIYLKGLK